MICTVAKADVPEFSPTGVLLIEAITFKHTKTIDLDRDRTTNLGTSVQQYLHFLVDVINKALNLRFGIQNLNALRVGIVAYSKMARNGVSVFSVKEKWPNLPVSQYIHQGLLMMQVQFLVRTEQRQDLQTVEHDQAVHGKHQVLECTMDSWSVVYTVWSGTLETPIQPRNLVMREVLPRDVTDNDKFWEKLKKDRLLVKEIWRKTTIVWKRHVSTFYVESLLCLTPIKWSCLCTTVPTTVILSINKYHYHKPLEIPVRLKM
ncbi:hypothetical protein C0J52_18180 [Blattella germanica]|nr:hypothetical protein C0J52_18180 [Blattella germanica]